MAATAADESAVGLKRWARVVPFGEQQEVLSPPQADATQKTTDGGAACVRRAFLACGWVGKERRTRRSNCGVEWLLRSTSDRRGKRIGSERMG